MGVGKWECYFDKVTFHKFFFLRIVCVAKCRFDKSPFVKFSVRYNVRSALRRRRIVRSAKWFLAKCLGTQILQLIIAKINAHYL